MSPSRRAEAQDVRPWQGTVAAANELDSHREWVVWGVGRQAPSVLGAEPGNDIAEGIACADGKWAELGRYERWVINWPGIETDLDELLADSGSVMGHAPYLAPGNSDEIPAEDVEGES